MDDIAKLYDVSKHPEIVNGSMTAKEVFMQYMSLWDTQVPDGIITFQEFCEYYRDVSASIEDDEYFGVMMTAAWKLWWENSKNINSISKKYSETFSVLEN